MKTLLIATLLLLLALPCLANDVTLRSECKPMPIYRVKSNILKDHVSYAPGGNIDLTLEEAAKISHAVEAIKEPEPAVEVLAQIGTIKGEPAQGVNIGSPIEYGADAVELPVELEIENTDAPPKKKRKK